MEWNPSNILAAIFVAVTAGFIVKAVTEFRSRKPGWKRALVCAVGCMVLVAALFIHGCLSKISPGMSISSATNTVEPDEKPTLTPSPSPSGSTPSPSPTPSPKTSGPSTPQSTAPASLLLAQQDVADGQRLGLDKMRKIGTVLYPHSLITPCSNNCVDKPNFIEYGLSQGYSRLEVTVGIEADRGSSEQIVIFKVKLIGLPGGGEKEAYNKKITFGQEEKISIPLEGATRIRLETLYGGENAAHARDLSINPVWGTPTIHQ